MIELIMVREGQALKARDPHSFELMMGITPGKDLMAKVSQPRNPGQHKLIWAMCKLIADNHPQFADSEHVMMELKRLSGLLRQVTGVNPRTGEVVDYFVVESISWATMDQVRFAQVFRTMRSQALRFMLPGVTDDQISSQLLEMLG